MPDKVIKPQSPIRNGDESIYPLTTYDQVILPDGSRWNGIVIEGDRNSIPVVDIDGEATEQVVPINAQTIDGLTYKQIIELEHGIGSFYFTLNAADDPNNKWNWMTWELVTDKFLLGAGNLYEGGVEGGEIEHTLTVDEMPEHGHGYPNAFLNKNISTSGEFDIPAYSEVYFAENDLMSTGTGGSQPHNNMPPYLSIFMWTRVA